MLLGACYCLVKGTNSIGSVQMAAFALESPKGGLGGWELAGLHPACSTFPRASIGQESLLAVLPVSDVKLVAIKRRAFPAPFFGTPCPLWPIYKHHF